MTVLAELEAGTLRAAWPDPAVPGGWRVDPAVKEAILACFADRTLVESSAGPLAFGDRAGVPPRDWASAPDALAARSAGRPQRVVPGGTSVRAGAHLGPGVVIMPPAFVNVGAWVGEDTMIDSHVLVGSCAQVGSRVHLSAAVQIGGVLEPANARPVVVEDDAFVGAGCLLLEGLLVGAGAVLGAGTVLTGTSRIYDLVGERILQGTPEAPLVVPAGAVVVPGSRPARGDFAAEHGLAVSTALLVKMRDAGTSARVALQEALR